MINSAIKWVLAVSEARRTRRILNTLTDRELQDIGITRCQINDVSFGAVNNV